MKAFFCGVGLLGFFSTGTGAGKKTAVGASYDHLVLADKPVGYWLLTAGSQADASGHGLTVTYHGAGLGQAALPNGETANTFDGTNTYFEVPNNAYLPLTRTGILTIEAWLRPAGYNYPNTEGDGYVYWLGQGTPANYSWSARMYNQHSAARPQRLSGYCFNLRGGLGAGSYFQDRIPVGTWVQYVLIINTRHTSSRYPTGYTRIYRDGVLRDTDSLQDYNIVPGTSTAPLRVATQNFSSFFAGAIGKVALYDYELTAAQLLAHNTTMRGQ